MDVSSTTLVILIVIGGMTLIVPRHLMIAPLFIIACLVPSTEEIVIAGFNFQPARVIIAVGISRALLGAAGKRYRYVPMDGLVLFWGANLALMTLLRDGSMARFVQQLGRLYEIYGLYFLARLTIQSKSQLYVALYTLAWCAILSAGLGVVEWMTHRRPLAFMYDSITPEVHIREGAVRVEGVFPHPNAFGNFMCVTAALCWGLIASRRKVMLGIVGMISAIVCVGLSRSGTPVSTLGATLLVLVLFYIRPVTRWVLWGSVAFLGMYHMFWGKWWGLVCRASNIVGGSGYHRAELINKFWQHIGDWAFIGSDDVSTWNVVGDPANNWVTEGLSGGLVGFIVFTSIVVLGFITIRRALRMVRDPHDQALFWSIGSALFAFCVSFIGLANFGQINVLWIGLLGMIGSVAESMKGASTGATLPHEDQRNVHGMMLSHGAPDRFLPGRMDNPAGPSSAPPALPGSLT